jgi:hypothetical protein
MELHDTRLLDRIREAVGDADGLLHSIGALPGYTQLQLPFKMSELELFLDHRTAVVEDPHDLAIVVKVHFIQIAAVQCTALCKAVL